MVQQPTERSESRPTRRRDEESESRRERQMKQREAELTRRSGGPRAERGLEHFRHPLLLLTGGALAYAGLKRFGKMSSLFLMGVGGGLVYRVLQQNDLLDGRLKQRLLQTAASKSTHVRTAITIDRPVEDVYRAWRSLENLAESMRHIDSVEPIDGDGDRWHFRAHIPGIEVPVEWDAEIIEDRENERLVWRSTEEADLHNEGTVEFRPRRDNSRTEMHVDIVYHPPAGDVGRALGQFLRGLTEQTIKEDVRRFKQFLEAGVVATIEGQSSGRREMEMPTSEADRPTGPTVH